MLSRPEVSGFVDDAEVSQALEFVRILGANATHGRRIKKTQAEFAANATSDFLDILDVKLTGGTLPPKKAKDSEDATRRLYIDLYLGEAKWNVLEEKNVSLPKEGFTIAFDEIVIAKDAPRKDLAYAFINYLYMAEVAKVNMEFLCGPNPVKPGLELLDEEYRKQILLDAETLKHGQVLKGFDDPKVMELYNKAWDRIKATEAK